MSQVGKTLVCILGVALLSLRVGAANADADNPYLTIVERNVFGLKDPPPPPSTEPPKTPPPPIILTGITTILGDRRVILKTAAVAGKAQEQSYILRPGEREGEIQVLEIDDKAGTVTVMYAGTKSTLDFEKNGPKLVSAPPMPVPGAPGLPAPGGVIPAPNPGGVVPNPGMANPAAFPNPSINKTTIPTRSLRLPGTANSAATPANYGPATGPTAAIGAVPVGAQPGIAALPIGTPNPAALNPNQGKWPPEQNLTREEQAALMEIQRELYLQNGNEAAARLLPGTGLNNAPPQLPGQQPKGL